MARPSSFTTDKGDAICARIVEGESLRAICRDDAMPSVQTVFNWFTAHPAFLDQYTRAKEQQADTYADEIVSISDEENIMVRDMDGGTTAVVFDSTAVARNRLRVDARKWVAAKLKPKKYGDRQAVEHSGPESGPIELSVTLEAGEAYRRMLDAG